MSAYILCFFYFYVSGHHRDLHSFPTRRSSDLSGVCYLIQCCLELLVYVFSLIFFLDQNFVVCSQAHVDRKSTRLNSSHVRISYAVFCLKKKKKTKHCISHLFSTVVRCICI